MSLNLEFQKQIQNWDGLIKNGNVNLASQEISHFIKNNKLKREFRLPLAQLLRRMGRFENAINLLFSIVRPSERNPILASKEELLEYSASLIQNGGITEGRELLKSVDLPMKNLYLAFSYFGEWDYQNAIPYLTTLCDSKGIDSYQKLIAQVNLFAALVASNQYESATQLRQMLLEKLKNSTNKLLYANCCEIEIQLLIGMQNFHEAHKKNAEHKNLFSSLGNPYKLYFEKWDLITQIYSKEKKGMNFENELAGFKKIKHLSIQNNFYEIARDCDFWLSHFNQNHSLINYLYFGTPWEHYKKKILNKNTDFTPSVQNLKWKPDFENGNTITEQQILYPISKSDSDSKSNSISVSISPPASASASAFDKMNQKNKKIVYASEFYQNKDLPDQLIQLLITDFYSPWKLGRLFNNLYPREYFIPYTSNQKIQQLVHRARKNIKLHHWNFKIIVFNKNYSFYSSSVIDFSNVDKKVVEIKDKKIHKLKQFIIMWTEHSQLKNKNWYSVSKLSQLTNTPKRTCTLYLNELLSLSWIIKKGNLKSTQYKIVTLI